MGGALLSVRMGMIADYTPEVPELRRVIETHDAPEALAETAAYTERTERREVAVVYNTGVYKGGGHI